MAALRERRGRLATAPAVDDAPPDPELEQHERVKELELEEEQNAAAQLQIGGTLA